MLNNELLIDSESDDTASSLSQPAPASSTSFVLSPASEFYKFLQQQQDDDEEGDNATKKKTPPQPDNNARHAAARERLSFDDTTQVSRNHSKPLSDDVDIVDQSIIFNHTRELPCNASYYVSLHRIDIDTDDKLFEIALRPDVAQADIIILCEQILMSFGGTITAAALPASTATIIPGNATGSEPSRHSTSMQLVVADTKRLTVHIGVTLTQQHQQHSDDHRQYGKERVLLLHAHYDYQAYANPLVPSSASSSSSSSRFLIAAVGQSSNRDNFLSFANTAYSRFAASFHAEKLTKDTSTEAGGTDASQQQQRRPSSLLGQQRLMESIVDLTFVEDLQAAYAQEMVLQLQAIADSLDKYLKVLEGKCARLMTVLKPTYTRCNLSIPTPPVKKVLSDYPLELSQRTILEPCVEMARMLILRGRRALKEQEPPRPATCESLIQAIGVQLRAWVEGESSSRIKRKTQSIRDRVQDIEVFRSQLVWSLHTRYFPHLRLPLPGSTSGSSGSASGSNTKLGHLDTDRSYMSDITTKYRILNEKEPVLIELPITVLIVPSTGSPASSIAPHQRKGKLFVSASHLILSCPTPGAVTALSGLSDFLNVSKWGFGLSATTPDVSNSSSGVSGDTTDLSLKVIPLFHGNIQEVSIVLADGSYVVENILAAYGANEEDADSSRLKARSTNNTMLITHPLAEDEPEYCRVVDRTGFQLTFTVPSYTPDYPRRIADLLDILIKHDYYKKATEQLQGTVIESNNTKLTETTHNLNLQPSLPPKIVVNPTSMSPKGASEPEAVLMYFGHGDYAPIITLNQRNQSNTTSNKDIIVATTSDDSPLLDFSNSNLTAASVIDVTQAASSSDVDNDFDSIFNFKSGTNSTHAGAENVDPISTLLDNIHLTPQGLSPISTDGGDIQNHAVTLANQKQLLDLDMDSPPNAKLPPTISPANISSEPQLHNDYKVEQICVSGVIESAPAPGPKKISLAKNIQAFLQTQQKK